MSLLSRVRSAALTTIAQAQAGGVLTNFLKNAWTIAACRQDHAGQGCGASHHSGLHPCCGLRVCAEVPRRGVLHLLSLHMHCASLHIVLWIVLPLLHMPYKFVVVVICFLTICALRWQACRSLGSRSALMAQSVVWYRARAWCVMCFGWLRRTRQLSSSSMRWTPLPQRVLMLRLELTGQALSHHFFQEPGSWAPCFSSL